MIRRLAECTASYFVRNGIVDSSEEDVYRYGIEVMLCDVVDYMIVLLSGIIFGRLIEAIWFYSNFLIIRSVTEGYHARTFISCKCMMAAMMLLVLTSYTLLPARAWYIWIGVAALIITDYKLETIYKRILFISVYFTAECLMMRYYSNLAVLMVFACIIVCVASNIKRKEKTV